VGIAVNLTPHAVGELVARDVGGAPLYVVVVKASFSFGKGGALEPIAPRPILDLPRYAGEPATSGLVAAGDLTLPKPRVDVLLQGALQFSPPLTHGEAALEVGGRIAKRLSIFGARVWLPGARADLVPTRPAPVSEMPLAWERSWGGSYADDPSATERRNPAGRALGRTPAEGKGKPLANFENPDDARAPWNVRRAPAGFGPVAPHWEPRASLAGTYDDRWRERRAPLLPEDFSPAFLNEAPADQQLASYLPGEEVRLTGMTATGRERFRLPELLVPVMFVQRDVINETRARVDTVIIEPAESRVSLVARATCSPRPTAAAVREVFVGQLTRGRRLALELGKPFLDLRALPAGRGE
jgi:hypothetical protein